MQQKQQVLTCCLARSAMWSILTRSTRGRSTREVCHASCVAQGLAFDFRLMSRDAGPAAAANIMLRVELKRADRFCC